MTLAATIFAFCVACAGALVFTSFFRRLSISAALRDRRDSPGGRKLHHAARSQIGGLAILLAWMATVFARHEVWALPILMGSHLIETVVDTLAGSLPREAVGRVARAVVDGVRRAGRPVEGVERGAGVPRR